MTFPTDVLPQNSIHVPVNDQLDAQFFFRICLFQISTCFEHSCSSSGELIVSIQHLVYQMSYWYN